MKRNRNHIGLYVLIAGICLFFWSCESKKRSDPAFEVKRSDATGLHFANRLASTDSFNLFRYMYFYNGAGVGAGDLNNDGLIDLFFCSNQGSNALFLNQGQLQFKEVTKESGIGGNSGWSTGVALVDINNDGLLDIYVSRVGKFRILNSHNQFLICQGIDKDGIPHYTDKAKEYGLDFSGFATQAAFLDYDMDGDLDIFLLNHSVNESGVFRARNEFLNTYHPVNGSRLYRNDGDAFTDITRGSGINSSGIGYGLGIVVTDINIDGYPDIYIGNDFHENDYLYINQKNGTFRDESAASVMHTSQFTMGVDAADADNDGYPEIISMDMLPPDPNVLKRSLGGDAFDIFNLKIKYGYNYQYARNNLQFNRRNDMFSEIGLYAGIAATDWSWGPLWMDFDNDGLKDLFISNGIPKRMNDIDYINYLSDQEIQQKIHDVNPSGTDKALIEKFPQIRIPNKFFRNNGALRFTDMHERISEDAEGYSNGSVFADFDNDGDLDVVVNNIDEEAILYKNTLNDKKPSAYISITLKGGEKNINAVGSRILIYADSSLRTYDKYPVRGFQSSMETPLIIGLNQTRIDSAFVVWPDNTCEPLRADTRGNITLTYRKGLPVFDYTKITAHDNRKADPLSDITSSLGIAYTHKEDVFVQFNREPLIPRMLSAEGPALAVADINHDGLEDFFIGGAAGFAGAVFLQKTDGKFFQTNQAALQNDSASEDIDACWADINGDGHADLIVASGGDEYSVNDPRMSPRAYLNDGKGNLVKKADAFNTQFPTTSCVAATDFNGDGYTDLFIGGRSVPGHYGSIPASYLLQNDRTGKFIDITPAGAQGLSSAGFVTDAVWIDLDNDNDQDLIICSEWGTIDAWLNDRGAFKQKILCNKKGWWNFLLPCDVNGDGQTDFIAGNLGLNSRLKASEKEPVRLYYNDFDGNGRKEQALTYYLQGKEIPFASKAEMEKQIPTLRKRFIYAADFAEASLEDILTAEKMRDAELLTANYFASAALINKGNLQFDTQDLPWQAQLTSYRDAVLVNANADTLPDFLMAGNFYESNVEMGRYDADFGTLLLNKGHSSLYAENTRGARIIGQARHIRKIRIGSRDAYLIARNNESLMAVAFEKKRQF